MLYFMLSDVKSRFAQKPNRFMQSGFTQKSIWRIENNSFCIQMLNGDFQNTLVMFLHKPRWFEPSLNNDQMFANKFFFRRKLCKTLVGGLVNVLVFVRTD